MRNDVHSEKNLKPEDYEFVRDFQTEIPDGLMIEAAADPIVWEYIRQLRDELDEIRRIKREEGVNIHGGIGSCDHCGARYKYGSLIRHIPTGKYLTIGCNCAEGRFSMSNAGFARTRMMKQAKAMKARIDTIKWKTAAWRLMLEWARENREAFQVLARVRNHKDYQNDFTWSVRDQFLSNKKKFNISKAQIDALVRFGTKVKERRAQRQAEAEAGAECPEGRVEINGVILSRKYQENNFSYYGSGQIKVLVRDDRGFKVWGTLASSIDDADVGDRIKFVANVQKSKDDPTFGFFKRPKGASLKKVA